MGLGLEINVCMLLLCNVHPPSSPLFSPPFLSPPTTVEEIKTLHPQMEYLQSAYDYASSYACPPPPPESSPPTYLSPLQPHIKNFNTLVGDTPLAREKNKVPVVLGFFLFFTSIYILENFLQPGVSSSSKSSRHAWCVKVRSDEERSNKLITFALGTKVPLTRTFVFDSLHPKPPPQFSCPHPNPLS